MQLSFQQALDLQKDLIIAYKGENVQNRLKSFQRQKQTGNEDEIATSKEAFLLEIQMPLVAKYGFEASPQGVQDAMMAISVDDINLNPEVYKRNNWMEILLCAGSKPDAYMPGWQQTDLHLLGRYRELPKQAYPIVDGMEQRMRQEGCLESEPRDGCLSPESTEELIMACRNGDVAKASQLLGMRKVSSSSNNIIVNLGYKSFGSMATKTLAKAFHKDLEEFELDISGNNIGVEGAKALAAGLPKKLKVLKLNLAGNRLTLAGVKAIADAIPKDLEILYMGFAGMKMGPLGAIAIADKMPPKLKELALDFYGNDIKDEGMIAISKALPKTIEYLNLMLLQNQLSRKGFYAVDRQIDDPMNEYYLPNLISENYKKTAALEVAEFKSYPDGTTERVLDWRTDI